MSTIAELKAKAAALGIDTDGLKKDEIVDAIADKAADLAASAEAAAAAEEAAEQAGLEEAAEPQEECVEPLTAMAAAALEESKKDPRRTFSAGRVYDPRLGKVNNPKRK